MGNDLCFSLSTHFMTLRYYAVAEICRLKLICLKVSKMGVGKIKTSSLLCTTKHDVSEDIISWFYV